MQSFRHLSGLAFDDGCGTTWHEEILSGQVSSSVCNDVGTTFDDHVSFASILARRTVDGGSNAVGQRIVVRLFISMFVVL